MPPAIHRFGSYQVLGTLGSGGMATVLLGRYRGPMEFWRPVAIKRLHEPLARDPAFVSMLLDEARLGSMVHHPLVAEVIDLMHDDTEVCLVMQYVHGAALRSLLDSSPAPVPISIAAAVLSDTLQGLHAAHEARNPEGVRLGIVHRDVSPHNLLVGVDGFTRVTDFGIAKAIWRAQSTCDGQLKGKLAYMAPEQLGKGKVDRRADIFSAAVILWEVLAGKRLFEETNPDQLLLRCHDWSPPPIGREGLPPELEQVVARGLASAPDDRFESALQMATALERACPPAPRTDVAAWVQRLAAGDLARRNAQLAAGLASAPESAHPSSGAWKVAPDSATLPNLGQAPEGTPPGLGSVTADSVVQRKRGSRRAAIVAATLAAIVIVLTVFFDQLGTGGGSVASQHATSSARTATPASPGSGELVRPEPVQAPPLPALSVAVSSVPVVAMLPKSTPARAIGTQRPPTPKQSACNPPYRTDDAGVKIYKMECL